MERSSAKLSDKTLLQFYDISKLQQRFPNEKELIYYLYHDEMLSKRQVGLILGCSDGTVHNRMKEYEIGSRSQSQAQIIRQGHLRRDFDSDDRLKAYMIGFCIGDAYVKKLHEKGETIKIDGSSTKPNQVRLFYNLFSPFGHVWIGRPDPSTGKIGCVVYLNMSFDFLLDLDDTMPSFILSEAKIFFAFFAGYIDAEGHIGLNYKRQAELRLESHDCNIIHQTQAKLAELGISCPKPWISRPKGYVSKGIVNNQDSWCLQITAKGSLIKLFGQIGPYLRHADRIGQMRKAIWNIESRS